MPPPQRRRRRWYRRPGFWLGLLFFALLVMVVLGATVAYAVANIPLPTELDTTPTTVLDKNGKEIGQLSAEATREDVALADIPEHTVQAVLAAEDAEFYEHPGVSVPGIVRAAVRNVRSGEVRQGGSTISQQYVKTVTGDTEQTSMRKVREAVLAMKLEREVSKDQILEYYLNTIYFGRGAYGIQAASRAYFDKDVGDLTIGESALLAGFIPAPSASDPVDHPERAAQRYQYVVGQLGTLGWIDESRAAKLSARQPEVTPKARRRAQVAPHFMAMVEQELNDRMGGDQAYRGLTVQTTLDPRLQRTAEKAYKRHFDDLREQLRGEYGKDVKVPSGAMVSLDPKDGAIRALVGGRPRDEYNLVTGGPQHLGRQPGSTFKPFALAAWLDSGRSPESRFDAPATMEFTPEESDTREGWDVSNYGLAAYGDMTLREATWNSVNTVYAQVALEVGPRAIADLAQEAGVTNALTPNPSIVLGTGEVTPLDLASAYNTLASGGVARTPRTIETVTDESGEVRYQPNENKRRVLSKGVAWTVVDVLRGVIEQGSGAAAQIGRPAAGKTGTTQNAADTWFAGFTRELTTVTWMGYRDSNEPMPGSPTGGGFTAELWADYMSDALEGVEPKEFPEPSGDYEIVGEPSPEPSAPVVEEPEPESEPAAAPPEEPSELGESAEEREARLREERERRRREEEQQDEPTEEPQTEPPAVGDGPNVVPPEDEEEDPPWWERDD
ncbi:MAG TPA: PBP1A family penicillin-binding protein [Euzebyales bacterium]|nr:PBP1A family penicillin-binding protein [Euzebyales bacterium]